jgi:hypothetical protein
MKTPVFPFFGVSFLVAFPTQIKCVGASRHGRQGRKGFRKNEIPLFDATFSRLMGFLEEHYPA